MLEVIGWLGNACFFSRFLVQWIASERARRSVSPAVFWRLSMLGSLCLGAYTFAEAEYVLLVGCVVNGAIAARNLRLGSSRPVVGALAATIAGTALTTTLAAAFLMLPSDPSLVWLVCAVVGQALWSSRFVLQWWSSERRGESHFPTAFWWISLAGNSLLLAYAFHLGNAVLVAGYIIGPFVQVRNLILLHRARMRDEPEARNVDPARHPV